MTGGRCNGADGTKTPVPRHIITTDGIRWVRLAMLVGGALILYLSGRWVSQNLVRHFGLLLQPHNEPLLHRTIMTATALYIVLMAVPFMPAAEIGLSMLVIFGGKIAFLVYLSTVVALSVAYGIGRLLPAELVMRSFGLLGLARFVRRLAQLSEGERLALLEQESPVRLARLVARYRFAVLVLLLNVPGNIVIGGGGGIALVAGMTRLFPFPMYLLAVTLAVAPVPLIVFLTD